MAMVQEVNQDMQTHLGRPLSASVTKAMQQVPREAFVPSQLAAHAYENRPLPIGDNQTISQPFIVALMTDLLELKSTDRVLELGTGSGYQAAVAAEIAQQVYTVEIIEQLAQTATERLEAAGYSNVRVRHGDGRQGWVEAAPFNAIIVTAAGDVPDALLKQLAPGGRLIIPVGGQHEVQQLRLITRSGVAYEEQDILPVRFVPITETLR